MTRPFYGGDTLGCFDGRADDYARYRPSYPEAALDLVLAGLGPAPRTVDVGAGTGIASRLLLARGARVTAVEPNAGMREAAVASGVDARDGTATLLPVEAGSAELVTCFQSFHWFASPETLREFARVLVPGGRLALVWNERDDADPFTRDYGALVDGFAHRRALASHEPGDALAAAAFGNTATGLFGAVRRSTFSNAQTLDREGLLGRVRSTSYAPRDGDDYARLLAGLDALVARFAPPSGTLTLAYRTDVYLTERT